MNFPPCIVFILPLWIFCCGLDIKASTVNPCDAKNCTYNVSCNINPTNPSQCLCLQGHYGDTCDDIDECSRGKNDPCRHRGVCTNTPGSYRCTCIQGWTAPENHCSERTHENVTCLPGYYGVNCTETECGNGYAVPYNNTATGSKFRCICDRGWNNTRPQDSCNIDINECIVDKPCHHGNCSNTNGSYNCNCDDHWKGHHCDYYDICNVTVCNNTNTVCQKDGTDNDTTHFKCVCKAGWKGDNCSDAVTTTTTSTLTTTSSTTTKTKATTTLRPHSTASNGTARLDDDVGGSSSVPVIAAGAVGGFVAIATGVVVSLVVYRYIRKKKIGIKDDLVQASSEEGPGSTRSAREMMNGTNNINANIQGNDVTEPC